ncbi:TIGR04222 domain-containing membrane protein [Streptomyces sp. NPDC048258]|uniref:TIGR04222 domain-containing membrane protein n=1 Tax=Streptomyces sp. NPDC048258 TaxID=3365527 RepID=UPI003722BA35
MWVFIFLGAGVPLLAATVVRVLLHRGLRERVASGPPATLYEAAHLHGGRQYVAELALTALHLAGLLSVGADGRAHRGPGRPEPAAADAAIDPVQTAALGFLDGEDDGDDPPHLAALRTLTADSPAALAVETALGPVRERRRRRQRQAEWADTAQAALARTAGLATLAACVTDSARGGGLGLRPLLAFTALGVVTGLLSLLCGPPREPSAPTGVPPCLVPGVPLPAEAAATLTRVARAGVSRHDGSAPLAAHLDPGLTTQG